MSHKMSLPGKVEVDGKYKVGEIVIGLVEGIVKSDPHNVGTANGGIESQFSVTLRDIIPINKKADPNGYDDAAKRFQDMRNERGDGEQDSML